MAGTNICGAWITSGRRGCGFIKEYASLKYRHVSTSSHRPAVASPATRPEPKESKVGSKPFDEMPGPKGLPVLGTLLELPQWVGKQHLMQEARFEKYGPTYRETMGSQTFVYTKDIAFIERMCRLEDKYPRRIAVTPWLRWREENGHTKGLIIDEGQDWKRMRGHINKQMLRPRHVATYTDRFNEVVTDFIERLIAIRDTKGDGLRVPELNMELFHWALETIGTVLYEIRFGGFEENRDPKITKFIQAVHQIFKTTEMLVYLPKPMARIFMSKWLKMHDDSWETIFTTGKGFIDAKISSLAEALDRGEGTESLLGFLVSQPDVSRAEVYSNVSELMIGAVDTTSNTMQWLLYELARHPEVQHKLHKEVKAATNGGATFVDQEALQTMPYLKAIIKEVLRLYPVGSGMVRILNEDMELGGYHIPKDTSVITAAYWTGRQPDFFPKPLTFDPDRWLRDPTEKMGMHNFGWLPFGFGPRMCIGRRVAELEMYLLTARISERFELLPGEDEPLEVVTRSLLVPSRGVNVQFIDRK